MHTTLHADTHTAGGAGLSDHLQSIVADALGRFGTRITRVDAHLSADRTRARPSDARVHCLFEAHLVGQDPVIADEHAASAHRAIDGALHKLKRAVGKAIAMQDPRSRRTAAPAADLTVTGDATSRP